MSSATSVGFSSDQSFETGTDTRPELMRKQTGTDGETLEPATNLLPAFGTHQRGTGAASPRSHALPGGPDELAELALSVRERNRCRVPIRRCWRPTWWPKRWRPSRSSTGTRSASRLRRGTIHRHRLFPPLAKALVDGGRVSLEDMEPCSRSTIERVRASPAS